MDDCRKLIKQLEQKIDNLSSDLKVSNARLEAANRQLASAALQEQSANTKQMRHRRSLEADMRRAPEHRRIHRPLSAVVEIGIKVVAEGVETRAQLDVLRRHGCEMAQGYHFGRPLAADGCRKFLCDVARHCSFTDTLRLQLVPSTR